MKPMKSSALQKQTAVYGDVLDKVKKKIDKEIVKKLTVCWIHGAKEQDAGGTISLYSCSHSDTNASYSESVHKK